MIARACSRVFRVSCFAGRFRRTACVLTCLAVTACQDARREPGVDSALARDLALANAVAVQPELNDVPVAPAVQPERVMPTPPPAPVRRPRAAATPPQRGGATSRPAPEPRPRVRAEEPAAGGTADEDGTGDVGTAATRGRGPGFAAGTRFPLTTGDRICTVSGRPGDKIVATLHEDVHGTGGAVIRAGTVVVLEVASTAPGDPPESGRITFRVRALDVNERSYPARGSGTPAAPLERAQTTGTVGASDRRKVITGAVAGAILGRVLGGSTQGAVIGAAAGGAAGAATARSGQVFEGCLPAGSSVVIVLEDGVTLA